MRRALTEAFPPVMLLQVHCFKFGPVSCPKRMVYSSSSADYKQQFHFRLIFAVIHYVRTHFIYSTYLRLLDRYLHVALTSSQWWNFYSWQLIMSLVVGIRLQVLTVKSAEVTIYTTWCNVKKLCILRTQCIYVIVINTAHWMVFIIFMPFILREVVTNFCISLNSLCVV